FHHAHILYCDDPAKYYLLRLPEIDEAGECVSRFCPGRVGWRQTRSAHHRTFRLCRGNIVEYAPRHHCYRAEFNCTGRRRFFYRLSALAPVAWHGLRTSALLPDWTRRRSLDFSSPQHGNGRLLRDS